MFHILRDSLFTATNGSKPKHQRLSHEEWENRFQPRHRRWSKDDGYRFDHNRHLW